jgi:hypothetical protein
MSSNNTEPFVFSLDDLASRATELHQGYVSADPFPHVVIDEFLPPGWAEKILSVFPAKDSSVWLDWTQRDTTHQPKKQGIGDASRLTNVSPYLQSILFAFNSFPFLNFLEKLTGIGKLLPDPYFFGGGIQQILSGGKLSIHTDFNDLNSLDLYRRINVLQYLNKDWKPHYNGNLELWNPELTSCVKSIAPVFNRLVVFNTTKRSFHGHPQTLNTPEDVTRKSIALYYYTAKPSPDEIYNRFTDWRDTP